MLIIDEQAERKLVKALEAVAQQENLVRGRCLHLHLSGQKLSPTQLHPHVIAAARSHLAGAHPELYLADDGDVFILTSATPAKFLRLLLLDVATVLQVVADETLGSMYDLDVSLHPLLVLLEQRIQVRELAIAQLQKKYEEENARRRRQAILDSDGALAGADVASRRRARATPELMVIEDDIFSRRLVENVLKKEFPLTSLGTAERALATYASVAPNVLFLDIDLPDVSGHELLQKMVALDPAAYIIMLSGNSDQANILQAMKAGAKGFIAKPFTRDKLLQYIERCPTLKH